MLTISIVNYFGGTLLYNCIRSVVEHTRGIDYEIIVVDNSNDPESKSPVIAGFPAVRWIHMDDNAGFGRANNVAFREAQGDAVLLLNPDCIAESNVVADCYRRLMQSGHAACGVNIVNEDGSFQISGNYAMTGGLNYLLPLPYLGSFMKWLGTLFRVEKPHLADPGREKIVDWINGAFLMVKKDIVDRTGGFDEDFFLYAEEAEWCSRIRRYGTLCIWGDLSIKHLQGAIATTAFGGESNSYKVLHDKKGRQLMLSNLVRIRKEFGLGWFAVILFFFTLTIPVYFIGGLLHSVVTCRNQLKHFTGFSYNIIKLYPFLPFIIRNKRKFYKVL